MRLWLRQATYKVVLEGWAEMYKPEDRYWPLISSGEGMRDTWEGVKIVRPERSEAIVHYLFVTVNGKD